MKNQSLSKITRLVNKNVCLLKNSEQTLKSIHDITFRSPHLVFCEHISEGNITSKRYGDIKRLSNNLASYIISLGIKTNEYIGILKNNSFEWIVISWAIIKSNHKPLLLNTMQDKTTNRYCLDLVSCKYLFSDTAFDGLISIDDKYMYEETDDDIEFCFSNEIALVSCGSSSLPKIAIYEGSALCKHIVHVEEIIPSFYPLVSLYKKEHRQFAFLPFYHIFGLFAVYFWFTFFHQILVFPAFYTPDGIIYTLKRNNVTSLTCVPKIFDVAVEKLLNRIHQMGEKTLQKFNKAINFSISIQSFFPRFGRWFVRNFWFKNIRKQLFGESLTFCISGGASLSKKTTHILNGLGYVLVAGYGLTEVGIVSFNRRIKAKDILKGNVGKVFSDIEIKFTEDNEILLRSPCSPVRVIQKDKIIELGEKNFYHTKDIGHLDEDGYLYIDGRKDEVIVLNNGELLSLESLDRRVNFSCAQHGFIYIDGKLILILHMKRSLETDFSKTLIEAKDVVSSFSILFPIHEIYVFKNEIPLTMKQVVSRTLLADFFINHIELFEKVDLDKTFDVKEVDIECLDEKLFNEIKDIVSFFTSKSISLNSSLFMDLGLDSLQYMELSLKLNSYFGLDFDPSNGIYFMTLKDIYDYIRRNQ